MKKDRKLLNIAQLESTHFPLHIDNGKNYNHLKGEMVLFNSDTILSEGHTGSIALLIDNVHFNEGLGADVIEGALIAGNIWTNDLPCSDITSYRVLTRRDLPLLIGYKHTTSLLAELIKGEI